MCHSNLARKDAPGPSRPPLVWSSTLSLAALAYAQHLASTHDLKHDPSLPSKQGENIFWSSSTTSPSSTLIAACNAWIEEVADYHGEVISPQLMNRNVGHYTQVVWPETRKVGMAKVKGLRGTYIVARYEPRGNVRGESAWGGARGSVGAGTSAHANVNSSSRMAFRGGTTISEIRAAATAAVKEAIRGNYAESKRKAKVCLGGGK
jgi:pathogenesis-related protein 1